jgi:pimeloyl-ACP methyl ester carboxylesterase
MQAGVAMDSLGAAPRFSISRWHVAVIWITVLSIQGASACAADAGAPIEVYGHLPSLEDLALSPDGTNLVFVRTSGDERNIYIRPLAENRVLGAARVGDTKLRSPSDPTLRAISPIEHIDAVTAPVLLIHGRDDTVVPFEQSEVMADALKHAGKSVEFVTLKHEDHWLSRSATRFQMLQSTVTFLKANNPPD